WPFLGVSTIETERPGLSFMIDSVKIMKAQYPGSDLYLLMGDDNLATLSTWKNWETIFDFVEVIVFRKDCRSQVNQPFLEPFKNKIHNSSAPVLEISSTEIRTRVLKGMNTDLLLPEQVQRFILTNGLYKN
ncbi:MAG: nicotinate-nicotinamide nucleotide adenylyltransferase, partial [Bacteroidetes bacterium]|nr:nicotinate-nicotinamide nucleotide adenylyltransferase [Bacteroidota bacterium]